MKSIILLLAAFFCVTSLDAQTNNQPIRKDSLKTLLKNEMGDSARVILLGDLSFAYSSNYPDSAMQIALEALSLAKRIGFVKGEAISLNRIGNSYNLLGNKSKAMGSFLSALKLFEKIHDVEGTARSLNNIGTVYSSLGEYQKAIEYYKKVLKLRGQPGSGLTGGVAQNNIARSYLALKKYALARTYSNQAYELAAKNNDRLRTGNALFITGSIYSETGQKNLALEYYRLSIRYSEMTENHVNLANTFLGMAQVFEKNRQIDSALYYARKTFKITRKAGFTKGTLESSKFLSTIYEEMENPDSAFFYLKAATLAKDSLFNQQNINQFYNLDFEEKLRQTEIAAADIKDKEERSHNLQFAAIAIGLLTFIILFFALSRSIIVKTKFIEFFGVLLLLAVFEFINLFIHPYLDKATNHSPVLMLLVLIVIGALLVPLHHKLEKWITKIMVEKNKKIRLEAAKKTIATLEPG